MSAEHGAIVRSLFGWSSRRADLDAATDHFASSTRSTKPVSTSPLWKCWLSMICRCSGIVVLIGAMWNSLRARFIVAIASARVGRWTISLPIMLS